MIQDKMLSLSYYFYLLYTDVYLTRNIFVRRDLTNKIAYYIFQNNSDAQKPILVYSIETRWLHLQAIETLKWIIIYVFLCIHGITHSHTFTKNRILIGITLFINK